MSWNILRSSPNRERKAEEFLERWGFERYVPMRKVHYRAGRSRARRTTLRPIFPQYLFVKDGHNRWGELLRAPGVMGFLRSGEKPAALSDDAIEKIREIEAVVAAAPSDAAWVFNPGDKVCYARKHYPFDGVRGVLQRLDKTDRVVIEVLLPGRAVAFATHAQWLRAV